MKFFNNSYFRALCAVVAGGLLLYYPDHTRNGLVIGIGIIFLLSGAISCISYFVRKRNVNKINQRIAENNEKFDEQLSSNIEKPFFPIVGIGSIILGFILVLSPTTFVKWLMYLLGVIIILAGVGQFASLIAARKYWKMHFLYWLIPSLLLLTGLFVIIYPLESSELPFIILGISLLVYGLYELIVSLIIGRHHRRYVVMLESSTDAAEVEMIDPIENKTVSEDYSETVDDSTLEN